MIVLSASKDHFLLSNLFAFHFFFSCFIALLNKSGVSEHPCLFPDCRGKVFSHMIKYDASYRFFTDALYQVKEVPFSS